MLGRLGACGGEVGGGELEDVEEETGALEVDLVCGEAGGDVGESLLDGVAGAEVEDLEGVVLDDGRDGFGAVGVAEELVVHGAGAAAAAVLFEVVHALVRQ